ncbi:MAG: phytochelatin synthase family protein, partial [Planctomycetota bacterium]
MDTAIPLSDDQGRALLDGCRCTRQFLSLAQQFQYQENLAYCGVATGCVVLNSLGCPAPASDTHGEFRYFTQSNLLGPGTEPVKPQSEIRMSGMALSEFTQIVMSHGPSALAIYGSDLDEDQLHATLSEHTSG